MIKSSNEFLQDQLEEMPELAKAEGVDQMKELIFKKLNHWKTIPLNVAVIGGTGTGKSSFIQAVMETETDKEGAADIGNTETITMPTPYKYPHGENLILWDFPEPEKQDAKDNFSSFGFDKCDFFLVMSSGRFSELDWWLTKEITIRHKKFFFVHTKIDKDLDNERKSHPKTFDEKTTNLKIKDDCIQNLKNNCSDPKIADIIFIISNFDPDKFEFQRLQKALIDSLHKNKEHAMTLSLNALSKQAIKEKRTFLERNMCMLTMTDAAAAATAVVLLSSGLSYFYINGYVQRAVESYQKQFGLDEQSLQIIKNKGNDVGDILSSVQKSQAKFQDINQYINNFSRDQYFNSWVLSYIPVIGSYTTYKLISEALMKMLNVMEEDAIKVMKCSLNIQI